MKNIEIGDIIIEYDNEIKGFRGLFKILLIENDYFIVDAYNIDNNYGIIMKTYKNNRFEWILYDEYIENPLQFNKIIGFDDIITKLYNKIIGFK